MRLERCANSCERMLAEVKAQVDSCLGCVVWSLPQWVPKQVRFAAKSCLNGSRLLVISSSLVGTRTAKACQKGTIIMLPLTKFQAFINTS